MVEMANEPIPAMKVNHVANLKAPLTPVAWLESDSAVEGDGVPALNMLKWNPIEYIGEYLVLKDGKVVAHTRQTQYPLTSAGEWQVIGVSADGVPSFASEPRSNREKIAVEFEGTSRPGGPVKQRTVLVQSPEVSYPPEGPVQGYYGIGYVETDRSNGPRTVSFEIPEDGMYSISVRYANGNGPVNTENKAAVRTLSIDGSKAGTIVMPTRGVANWNDWGNSNGVIAELGAGSHTLTVEYLPEDENMNIETNHALLDRVEIVKL